MRWRPRPSIAGLFPMGPTLESAVLPQPWRVYRLRVSGLSVFFKNVRESKQSFLCNPWRQDYDDYDEIDRE